MSWRAPQLVWEVTNEDCVPVLFCAADEDQFTAIVGAIEKARACLDGVIDVQSVTCSFCLNSSRFVAEVWGTRSAFQPGEEPSVVDTTLDDVLEGKPLGRGERIVNGERLYSAAWL